MIGNGRNYDRHFLGRERPGAYLDHRDGGVEMSIIGAISYIVLAPFAASFFWWAWGDFPDSEVDMFFSVLMSLCFWPVFLVIGFVLASKSRLDHVEKLGERMK